MTTPEEEKIQQEIREVYNSGDLKTAVQLACKFLKRFPQSPLARYCYAVMHGDYSYSSIHDDETKKELVKIAKDGISKLLHDPSFPQWTERFQKSVRNEYYWFFELPEDQYKLGLEQLQKGNNGHYSACVGASVLALKELRNSRVAAAEEWATKSLTHFTEFERQVPDWYNINLFAAQALACLGRYDEAMVCYKDQYRKQKSLEKPAEITEFVSRVAEIKMLRERTV